VIGERRGSITNTSMRDRMIVFQWGVLTFIVVSIAATFNTALPIVVDELALLPTESSWLISIYSIFLALASVCFSRLSDHIPISTLLYIGLFICGVSSVVGWFTSEYVTLLAVRLLQGIGAAAVPGLSFVYIARYIHPDYKRAAFLQLAYFIALGFGLGPILGGVIVQLWNWQALFLLPSSLILCIITVSLLQLDHEELIKSSEDPCRIWRSLIYWPGLLGLLQRRSYSFRVSMQFTVLYIQLSILYVLMMQAHKLAYSAIQIGLILSPGAVCSAFIIWRLNIWMRSRSERSISIGFITVGIGGVVLAVGSYFPLMSMVIGYFCIAIGTTIASASLNNELVHTLHVEETSSGLGFSQLVQFMGGAVGVTLYGFVLDYFQASVQMVYSLIFLSISVISALFVYAYHCMISRGE
jgi:DHA2 family metal-tetracycline-proton antiporter-like MFS transporter